MLHVTYGKQKLNKSTQMNVPLPITNAVEQKCVMEQVICIKKKYQVKTKTDQNVSCNLRKT